MIRFAIVHIFLISLCAASVENLNYKRVHFVDASPPFSDGTRNYLFRGNQPQNASGEFAIDMLRDYLEKRALEEANLTLPDYYYIVDISFLNDQEADEKAALAIERNFFNDNPVRYDHSQQVFDFIPLMRKIFNIFLHLKHIGKLVWWPLYGDQMSPYNYSQIVMEKLAINLPYWQPDKLTEKMHIVRYLLETQESGPFLYYFHCGVRSPSMCELEFLQIQR